MNQTIPGSRTTALRMPEEVAKQMRARMGVFCIEMIPKLFHIEGETGLFCGTKAKPCANFDATQMYCPCCQLPYHEANMAVAEYRGLNFADMLPEDMITLNEVLIVNSDLYGEELRWEACLGHITCFIPPGHQATQCDTFDW